MSSHVTRPLPIGMKTTAQRSQRSCIVNYTGLLLQAMQCDHIFRAMVSSVVSLINNNNNNNNHAAV